MQLTKRQRWDIIRKLVSDKNKEYARFLTEHVGAENLSLCVGYTKNLYLGKFGFSSESNFRYLLKHRGITPAREWLDNLSSEDLLLFLDFRCRTLQAMYDYCSKHDGISVSDIYDIIANTKRSSLINYNAGRLKATGKPKAQDNELSVNDLDLTEDEKCEQALSQIMGIIAINHAKMTDSNLDKAVEKVSKLNTSNIDPKGFVTGYKFIAKLNIDALKEKKDKNDEIIDDSKPRLVGFDINKFPVFMKGDDFVSITGEKLHYVKVVYDRNKVKIEEEDELDVEPQPKFVGLDIQGSPVYQHEDGYYTSTGRKLDEDEYIYSKEEIETLGL